MMIVLVIISILLLIAIPNLTKNQEMAETKGCEATKELIKAQVAAYEIDKGKKLVSLEELMSEGYVDRISCPGSDVDLTLESLKKNN
ncbi:competence protein ComG [Bacillus alkalicola]|uniref:Competence protein ComG n=2 Tax=Bacillales TaxID=1385 RepID=A0ABS6K0L8_9BACI|nr:competence protein ComG [Bacillus alkalicola]